MLIVYFQSLDLILYKIKKNISDENRDYKIISPENGNIYRKRELRV